MEDDLPIIRLDTPQEMDDLVYELADLKPEFKARLREDLIDGDILYTILLEDFTSDLRRQFRKSSQDNDAFVNDFIRIIYKYWKQYKDEGPLSVRNLIKISFFDCIGLSDVDTGKVTLTSKFPLILRRAYKRSNR